MKYHIWLEGSKFPGDTEAAYQCSVDADTFRDAVQLMFYVNPDYALFFNDDGVDFSVNGCKLYSGVSETDSQIK